MSIRIFETTSRQADFNSLSNNKSPPTLHKPLLFKHLKRRSIESAAAFLYLFFYDLWYKATLKSKTTTATTKAASSTTTAKSAAATTKAAAAEATTQAASSRDKPIVVDFSFA